MLDLAPFGELQAMAGQVAAVSTRVRALGEPSRLAGDPAALRALAASHRDVAAELGAAADAGGGHARAVVGGAWQGPASGAFADHWSVVEGGVRDLAGRHSRLAGALDDIASGADLLNRQVTDVVGAAETWLRSAAAAIATPDAGAVPGLVTGAAAILWRWRMLLPELEAFAGSLPGRMEIDLGVRLPPADVPGLDVTPPPVPRGPDLPPALPGPSVVYDEPAEPGVPDPSEIPPGSTPEEVIDKLPPEIAAGGEPSRKGGGVRYPDPNRPGDQVIIEPGDPNATDPLHQGPYVKISKGGTVTRVPLAGNPTL